MAHRPSPFGVPQREPEPPPSADEDHDLAERVDRATAPTMRISPEQTSPRSDEDLETHLERIHASRPLRRAAQRARHRTRWWLVVLAVVSGLAVVAACGAGAFIVLREGEPVASEPEESEGDADSGAPEVVDPIESRRTDAEPISVEELFGSSAIAPEGAAGAYEVLQTDELGDCSAAGIEEMADLLEEADCTQAVRATVVDPAGTYAVTAGVLNLGDAAEAERLREVIEADPDGGFAALRTDGAGAELGRAETMLGFNTYGHYLMYAVIGRTDGEAVKEADGPVMTVVNDLVDVWLVDRLSPRRTVE